MNKSLQQILVIDAQIRELEILYKRAQKSKKNASRYNLRLKLSVVSGECSDFILEWLSKLSRMFIALLPGHLV